MDRKKIIAYLFLVVTYGLYGQGNSLLNEIQYGVTLKAKLELRHIRHKEPNLNFKISASGGIGSSWIVDELYPSLNVEAHLYNGGLGSANRKDNEKGCPPILDAILAFTLTTGRPNSYFINSIKGHERNLPLRYFSDFAIPALQNPYNYSFSLGTNFVLTTDINKSSQRIGFLNVHLAERFQLSYYNDGTPFQPIQTGDGRDRYYTGGGTLSYSHSNEGLSRFNSYQFEASYHKFTGYTENAFELSNVLNTSSVDYKATKQTDYNKSLWKLNVQALVDDHVGYGLALAYYNSVLFDGQHFIHSIIDNSYHMVPYGGNLTVEPSVFVINNGFKKN